MSYYYIKHQNEPYFLTLNIVEWIDLFTNYHHRRLIVKALNYCTHHKGLMIYAWCIMHNQLLLVAQARPKSRLSAIMRDLKKYTSKKLLSDILLNNEPRKLWVISRLAHVSKHSGRIKYFKLWQDGGTADLLYAPSLFNAAISFVHQQPVFAQLVDQAKDYNFSSAKDYAGRQGMIGLTNIPACVK